MDVLIDGCYHVDSNSYGCLDAHTTLSRNSLGKYCGAYLAGNIQLDRLAIPGHVRQFPDRGQHRF